MFFDQQKPADAVLVREDPDGILLIVVRPAIVRAWFLKGVGARGGLDLPYFAGGSSSLALARSASAPALSPRDLLATERF